MSLEGFWVYLAASPLWWLTLTLTIYLAAQKLFRLSNNAALLNPVGVSVISLIVLLEMTHTTYEEYFAGAQFLHFLLGPATVALSLPLFRQLKRLKQVWLPAFIALIIGSSVGASSAVGIGYVLGLDATTLSSLAPKSVTTPVAMGISEIIGGIPSLTAVFVVFTGITGAMIGIQVLRFTGVHDDSALGIAMGVSAHGVGTARAFEDNPVSGAFAGLGMALAAFITALIIPIFFTFID